MQLDCKVQNYEWGKRGFSSKVASLCSSASEKFVVNEEAPYAELWMGTHPNGPSYVKGTGASLLQLIEKNPQWLGAKVLDQFGKNLPYLFKVLSVNQALSIQVHPSKKHAEELHANRPDLYKDPNHKPELAIALTEFEALIGFRLASEIKHFIKEVPELRSLIGKQEVKDFLAANDSNCTTELKNCFKSLMCKHQEEVTPQVKSILKRFSHQDPKANDAQLAALFQRLNKQYPNDIGCFAIYFLNVLRLEPLESIFLDANVPHAYLSGDCIECMACSDNVVRAGLTPKYKDVETLCEMLDYQGTSARSKVFHPVIEDEFCQLYKPPVQDFAVAKIEVPQTAEQYTLIPRNSATIVLCVEGKAELASAKLVPGTVVFIPANEVLSVKDINTKLLLFQAMANI